jgi:predicted HicB family RNase H-like nuclease
MNEKLKIPSIILKPFEAKSKRLNFLTKPSTLNKLQELSEKYKMSVNEFINEVLEQAIKQDL